ncbi:MAG: MerR family transcriptional regulator [Clostridiaceae bacterium]|nr:MerR family transcriptional regulator [Clostridiaceae bacterium]
MGYKINDVSKITGVTVRALHYYDKIGLLCPPKDKENGYRYYGEKEISRLQEIMFFRELDFSLEDIKKIIESPGYNRDQALEKHRNLLYEKRGRIDGLIGLIDNILKGEQNMNFNEFSMEKIEEQKEKYKKEVQERWGNTEAYKQSSQKTASYGSEDWKKIGGAMEDILRHFASARTEDPAGKEAQGLVAQWQKHISENYYVCTDEILSGLGQMYVGDERFKKNLDQYGEGTAEFISRAITSYCKSR